MKLSGSYKLKTNKRIVWKALNDPHILKQCIPGCESFKKNNDNTFEAIATNQIGPMNATFSGKITLSNILKNQSYTLVGEGHSSVGFANGKANVDLQEENNLTILNYDVDVEVGGKIAQLGSRLIDGVAKKMADYFFGRFADVVDSISTSSKETDKVTNKNRVQKLQSNFLNKYIYSALIIFVLLIVAIIIFVSR